MNPNFWVIIPAAGIGSRMQADRPKQYMPLSEKTVIEHTLNKLLEYPGFNALYVGLSPSDPYWKTLPSSKNTSIHTYEGGSERVDTVLNGLHELADKAKPDDWVLVHDVARPCISLRDIEALVTQLEDHSVGGILGVPVTDTVKKVENGCNEDGHKIVATIDRSTLWRAYTPQMFRYQTLLGALENGLKKGLAITDEASAIEAEGLIPKMVKGHASNIKITQPGDIELAEFYLSKQENTIK